jgi:hypothetical protein
MVRERMRRFARDRAPCRVGGDIPPTCGMGKLSIGAQRVDVARIERKRPLAGRDRLCRASRLLQIAHVLQQSGDLPRRIGRT